MGLVRNLVRNSEENEPRFAPRVQQFCVVGRPGFGEALRNTSKVLPMCDSNSSLADLQAEVAALEAEQEADNKVLARLKADKAARDARLYALRAQHEPETIFNLTALPPELLLCILRACTTARTLAACAQVCILLRDAIGGCDDLWMRHLLQHRVRRWWLCAVSHIPEGAEDEDPLTASCWHRIALPSPLCVTKHCVLLRELSAKESLIAARIDSRRESALRRRSSAACSGRSSFRRACSAAASAWRGRPRASIATASMRTRPSSAATRAEANGRSQRTTKATAAGTRP